MPNLYLDNFRGFSRTIIPFCEVNFLVGENSTGKSSLLALMHLLSTPDFWFSQNFNLAEYEFGGFRDILSATAPGESEFSFGIAAERPGVHEKNKKPFCFLASFCERDALPSLSFFARLYDRQLLAVRKIKKTWKYRTCELPPKTKCAEPRHAFSILQDERVRGAAGYLDLPTSIPAVPGIFPMMFRMLGNTVTKGEADPHEFIFPAPLLGRNLAWLAPIRTRPKQTYDGYGSSFSPEGEHTPYLLRKKLSTHSARAEAFRKALEVFGRESGLFATVEIHKFGDDAASPFELLVCLSPSCPLRINSVGYGVSQVLPLVVEILARGKGNWFAIQQPEVHLHPRAQAALGDLVFQMAETEQKHFFIETHSDFTVDRFRMSFERNPLHKTTAQVLFFERSGAGNTIHVLPLKSNGEYPEDQPKTFRDFFLREQMELLGLD